MLPCLRLHLVKTARVVYHLPKISGLLYCTRLDSSYNMAAQVLMLEEILVLLADREMLINSNREDEINTIGVISVFMRRDHHHREGFCQNIVPLSSMDEFSSHFRLSRASMEVL